MGNSRPCHISPRYEGLLVGLPAAKPERERETSEAAAGPSHALHLGLAVASKCAPPSVNPRCFILSAAVLVQYLSSIFTSQGIRSIRSHVHCFKLAEILGRKPVLVFRSRTAGPGFPWRPPPNCHGRPAKRLRGPSVSPSPPVLQLAATGRSDNPKPQRRVARRGGASVDYYGVLLVRPFNWPAF